MCWFAPVALANSTTSENWSGYAAHRDGVRFRTLSAEWLVPAPSCRSGSPGYSSMWVGLGGYRVSSTALEQAGVEVDCTASGSARYFGWYELVPAGPHTVSLDVHPGDLIRGVVGVRGHRVTILLQDVTSHRTFWKSFHPSEIDTTSADWILEAPSECTFSGRCLTLPLADFGRITVFDAHATTAGGHTATIGSGSWNNSEITLLPQGSRFLADTNSHLGEALPSPLTSGGSSFSVSYQAASGSAGGSAPPFFGVRSAALVR